MTTGAIWTRTDTTKRVRWSWLWGAKQDFAWNLIPFWLGFALIAGLFLTRSSGVGNDPMWAFSYSGHNVYILAFAMLLYGPLVDGPHLWATIARTYTDAEEWGARRKLFLTSLVAFAIGPVMILIPYIIDAITPIPAHMLHWGWLAWAVGFGFYAMFHINKQHWGFVSLYKRKNGDNDPLEHRIDVIFFHVAIWAPYFAMVLAPWGDTISSGLFASVRPLLFNVCHAVFIVSVAGYVAFQLMQWRKGVVRNGPKLVYIATIASLYYLTFAWDPRIAAFWILITGTGHCAQYHAVVWAYGKKRYAASEHAKKTLPQLIFSNFWLYAVLAILFALLTLQGPGADTVKTYVSNALEGSVFSHIFKFLTPGDGRDLGIKLAAAFISGVRLHHFYVDSKIWRVSKSKALAKNLSV